MKKLFLLISFCLMISYVNAQNEMWIYKSNGSVVKYNTSEIDSVKFMPAQEPDENVINIEANQLVGTYYGEQLVGGLGHYWIILSDNGFSDNGLVPNSEFFRIDLLGPIAEDENNIRIPDGQYIFDPNNNFSGYTIINIGNSDYVYVDNAGESWSTIYSDAKLEVKDLSINLTAIVEDKEYNVTFEGDYTISYNPIPDNISTLTSDHEIDLSNCTGSVKCFGDYWKCGYCNWQIEFICNDGYSAGTYFTIDFLTDANVDGSSGFEGTYQASGFSDEDPTMPNFGPYTYIPGMRISEDSDLMMGTLVIEHGLKIQAPIIDGEIKITSNNDGTHTITVDAIDDANPSHKITLNWTGILN